MRKSRNIVSKKKMNNYLHLASLKEIIIDIVMPNLVAIILLILYWIITGNNKANINFLENILDVNDAMINVFAILSGFSIGSLTMLASVSVQKAESIEESINDATDFYTFIVKFQISLLLLSLVLKIISPYMFEILQIVSPSFPYWLKKVVAILFSAFWFSSVVSCILITIRGIPMLKALIKLIQRS